VAIGSGGFTPRKVELGVRLDERMEITQGLAEGEEIVSSGVFLIDSESRLRASGGMGAGHAGHGTPEPEPGGTTSVHQHEEHRD
jgi:hypothetical protein